MDEDGRPLTEGLGEERPCPYPDRRRGQPMNVEALAQVRRHWPFITSRIEATSGPCLADAFRAALAATYAALRASAPIPAPLSALYKACVGFSQVFCFLLLEGEGMADGPPPDPEALFTWLERDGWLEGTRQVCAGPRALIVELAECFARGPGGPTTSEQIEVALQAALVLATYRAPGRGDASEGLGVELLATSRAPWMHAVTARPGREPSQVRRLFPTGGTPPQVEGFLAEERPSLTHIEREQLFWRWAHFSP